jgi:hypothetical protein
MNMCIPHERFSETGKAMRDALPCRDGCGDGGRERAVVDLRVRLRRSPLRRKAAKSSVVRRRPE